MFEESKSLLSGYVHGSTGSLNKALNKKTKFERSQSLLSGYVHGLTASL